MVKICSGCKKEKDRDTDFYQKLDSKSGKRYPCSRCKKCEAVYTYRWSEANRERRRELSRNIAARNVEYVRKQKKAPCFRCGNSYPPVAMDFHHPISDDKIKKVSALRTVGLKRIQEEIDKCVLLCAICHRITHEELEINAA